MARTRLIRRRPSVRWYVFAALWLLYFFMAAYQFAPASVLSILMDDLAIGPTAASWVISILFLAMSIAAIPAGIVLDRLDIKTVIVGATTVFVVATVWGWQASTTGNYRSLLGSRFLGGVCIVAVWTASVNGVGGLFPPDRQASAIGVFAASPLAGIAFGLYSSPLIAGRFGWALTFPVFGTCAVIACTGFVVPSRRVTFDSDEAQVPSWREFGAVLTNRHLWLLTAVGFVVYSLTAFLSSWLPTYAVDRFSFSLEASGLLGALFSIVGILSRASSGVLSDVGFGGRRKPLVVFSLVMMLPVLIGVSIVSRTVLLLLFVMIAGYASQVGLTILLAYVREVVAWNVVGTALAVLNAAAFFGSFTAPVIAGALIEHSGYLLAFAYAVGLAAAGGLIAWRTPEPAV